jgi:type II secretory pathway pseudopilin PulG
MSLLIKYLLTTQYKRRYNHQVSGFTMIELLVAAIMSFLIITPILTFAVSILNDDVKEQAKASTELELQSALDYIQQDISQAFYIYDGAGIQKLTSPTNQLYDIPNVNEVPVLVFWKRELVKNAIDVTTQNVCTSPANDDEDGNSSTTNPQKCDDTYVESLVAYYLVKDNNPKWCQPGTSNCPARIERWSIKDGAKRTNGTYLCGDKGDDTSICPDTDDRKNFRRNKGFNPFNYDAIITDNTDYPLSWARATGETYDTTAQVLVNYISPSTLAPSSATQCRTAFNIPTSATTPIENDLRIGVTDYTNPTTFHSFYGCVNSTNNIAQITIRGDALRRNDANTQACQKESPNCPSVSGQIGSRSGFGQ